MGYKQVFVGNKFLDFTFAQITSPATSLSIDVIGMRHHSLKFIMVGVSQLTVQGSLDNINFFLLPRGSTSTSGWVVGPTNVYTATADGTYIAKFDDTSIKFIRFDATIVGTSIDVQYHGET